MKTAISLYLADVRSPNLASSSASYAGCYISAYQGEIVFPGTYTGCGGYLKGGAGGTVMTSNISSTQQTFRKVDSTGWLPVNFSQMSAGTPFGNLPVDPVVNNAAYYYAYAATSTNTFEIDASMESQKYASSSANVVVNDGGDNGSVYEVGTATGLAL